MTKLTAIIGLVLLALAPGFAFAATPNEQYASFLRAEIAQLETELIQLQATSTPTTTPATPLNYTPLGNTLPSKCYDSVYYYSHEACREFEG